mgnify:FL=1
MLERWNQWVVEHPWTVVLTVLVCTVLAGWGLKDFENNNNPRIFFTEDNPDFQRFRQLEDRFTANEVVLFVVHPDNDEIFTRANLVALEELTEQAWTLPNATRVDSPVNFQHTRVDGDTLNINPLVQDASEMSSEAIEQARQVAVNEPSLVGRILSPEGHVAGVAVTVTMDEQNSEAPEITRAARKMARHFEQRYPDIEFMLTGTVVFSQATELATEQALRTILPLAFVVMLICLLLILRHVLFTGLVVLVVGCSIVIALGLSVWLGMEFSPVVGMAPSMILTLAVADCIHMLTTYRQQLLAGQAWRPAILESLRINFQPIWLTSITTALGFAILNFADSDPFRVLGNVVVMGVLAAFVLSVVLLPALIALVPHQVSSRQAAGGSEAMDRLAQGVIRYYRPLLAGTGVAVLILLASIPQNRINDVFNEYFDETFEVRRVNDFAMREMTGMHRIDYSLDSGEAGGTMDPGYLKRMDEFVSWLREQEHVVFVNAFSEVIKRLNRDMNQGRDEYFRIPDRRELISQYTLMYEMSLPRGLGLQNQLDINKRHGRVVVMLENIGSTPVLEFNRRAEAWMESHWPETMQAHGTGMDILFGTVTQRNIRSMLVGAAVALVAVSLLLMLALRSVRYGLLSLIPNLFPAGMAFGLWAWVNGEIGLAVSVVGCMTLGIVVDDTVHFLSKYVRAKRELGQGTPEAVRYAFRTVGVALVGTSVVLVANFAIIGTSHFYPNASMGQLSAMTIALALFVDFFFFVPLLIALDRRRRSGVEADRAEC